MAANCPVCRLNTLVLRDAFKIPAVVNPAEPLCMRGQCAHCGAIVVHEIGRPNAAIVLPFEG